MARVSINILGISELKWTRMGEFNSDDHYIYYCGQEQPTPVLLPGKPHGQRSLVDCSPWGQEESDTTEWLHFHFSLSFIGQGNSNPLQCSCLENPRDGRAWWAADYGVTQSRIWQKRLSSSSSRQVSLWINGVALIVNRSLKCSTWMQSQKRQNDLLFSQSKPFNITVIQVYAPTSNAEEAETKWFYEDLQDLIELTPKRDVLFITGD